MIRFGSWSTLLALGAAYGLTVALLLGFARQNRVANRLLAALIAVIVLKLCPYILGFAGYYDAWPWLNFAPFAIDLGLGPLLWLHVEALTTNRLPARWRWHLAPALLQFGYRLFWFLQPIAARDAWNDDVHARWIDPAETLLVLVSVGIYLRLAWRRFAQYQHWLDDHLSNREEFRLFWLRNFLIALAVMLAVWAPYEALSYLTSFNYYQRFPLYIVLMALIFYLGMEGWRHAAQHYPLAIDVADQSDEPPPIPAIVEEEEEPATAPRDWRLEGERWYTRLEREGWWRDPELSLDRLARHLGTNTGYVSRAFNDGLGMSFNEAVNRLRVAAVQKHLTDSVDGRDLLAVAFAAGFSSKTSFNRVFKALTGSTPTRYRAAHPATEGTKS